MHTLNNNHECTVRVLLTSSAPLLFLLEQCTGVFYDIGSGTVNCTLDTDGDGIPNVEVRECATNYVRTHPALLDVDVMHGTCMQCVYGFMCLSPTQCTTSNCQSFSFSSLTTSAPCLSPPIYLCLHPLSPYLPLPPSSLPSPHLSHHCPLSRPVYFLSTHIHTCIYLCTLCPCVHVHVYVCVCMCVCVCVCIRILVKGVAWER